MAVILSMLLFLSGISINPVIMAAGPDPANDPNWSLIEAASDEFDGNALDLTKWDKGLWYDTSGVLAFKESNVRVSDGSLILDAKKESYNGKAYTYGAVESKFDVPGVSTYVEVRAKALSSNANVLSAIWMQSSP